MERYKNIYFINLFPKRGINYYKIMSCKFLFPYFTSDIIESVFETISRVIKGYKLLYDTKELKIKHKISHVCNRRLL